MKEIALENTSVNSNSNIDFKKKVWPNDRGFFEISVLHAENTPASLKTNPKQLNIMEGLSNEPVIIDLGMGNGSFLIDLAKQFKSEKKKAQLIGVSASIDELRKHTCHYAGIEVIQGKLPYDVSVMELLEKRQGTVDKIFDSYGPTTYSVNPVHCMILATILLKERGKFSAMTSTEGNSVLTSVFGDEKVRKKIVLFFKKELGVDITFKFSSIKSRVTEGAINTDLLVTFTKGNVMLQASDYAKLCRKFDRVVGFPRISKSSWYQYRDFNITMKSYQPFETSSEMSTSDELEQQKNSL